MALPDPDSGVGHSFGLEVDGIQVTSLTDVGLKIEMDVIELEESGADGESVVRKLPGRWRAPEITISRGLTGDNSFDDWIKDSKTGREDSTGKNGAVIVYDDAGSAVKRYRFINAWPRSLEIGTLKAGDTSVLTEKLVVTCDGLEVE